MDRTIRVASVAIAATFALALAHSAGARRAHGGPHGHGRAGTHAVPAAGPRAPAGPAAGSVWPPSAPAAPGRQRSHGSHGRGRDSQRVRSGAAQTALLQGVVQSASAQAVVVKQIDGTLATIPVDRRTHVYLDGRPVRAADVAPGSVLVSATWKGHAPAASELWILTTAP